MHCLDEAQIGAGEPREHLDAEIGDEAVAEIGDGDVGDIFGDRLDDGHHHDCGGDPVDHALVLGDEHVVGRPLNEEGDGAGGRGGEDHGQRGEQEQAEAGPQMLPPDAQEDLGGRVLDLELVGAPRDRAHVPEQLIFQAFPRFLTSRQKRFRPAAGSSSTRPRRPLRRKTLALCATRPRPRRPPVRGRAGGADAR